MSAKINLKITGVRGGFPSYSENKGRVTTFVDNNDDFIAVDAFQGMDKTYKRREESEIEICIGGVTWRGTKAELATKLFQPKTSSDEEGIKQRLDDYLSMDYIPYNRVIQALKKALKKAEKKPHMTIEDVEVDVSENDDEVIMERLTPVQEMEFTPVTRFCEMCGIEAD